MIYRKTLRISFKHLRRKLHTPCPRKKNQASTERGVSRNKASCYWMSSRNLPTLWSLTKVSDHWKREKKNQPSLSGASLKPAWAQDLTLIQSKGLLLLEEEQDNHSFSWYKAAERGGRRGRNVNNNHSGTQVTTDCLKLQLQQEDQILSPHSQSLD